MAEDAHRSLIESATGGDPLAIDALLERHLPGLLTYVRLHLGTELAQREPPTDLVQSVCREVLENAGGFDYRGEGAFRNWLYKLALTKICDRQRYWHAKMRDRRREEGSASFTLRARDDSPSAVAIRGEDLEQLAAVFDRLPEDYRQVVSMAYVVGLSRREMAIEMGRSEAAVRKLLHRALARIGILMSFPETGLEDTGSAEIGVEPASEDG
jgi:RNA polymerase sigma-70 factor (ECF subfamily)